MQGYNLRSPAVKRILQELKECQQDDNPDVVARAQEDNIFEWHFVLRGPWSSEFEGGLYHGRILLPADYPFKPPSFVMCTPSGRWEVGTKICLSISSHHPESWQPSWSVRVALVALRAFMQTPAAGALGALDTPAEARRCMAVESRVRAPHGATPAAQALMQELHAAMLASEPASRRLHSAQTQAAATDGEVASVGAVESSVTDGDAATRESGEESDGTAMVAKASSVARTGVSVANDSSTQVPARSAPEDAASTEKAGKCSFADTSNIDVAQAAGPAATEAIIDAGETAARDGKAIALPQTTQSGRRDPLAMLPASASSASALIREEIPCPTALMEEPRQPMTPSAATATAVSHTRLPSAAQVLVTASREDRGVVYLSAFLLLALLAIFVRKAFSVGGMEADDSYYVIRRTPVLEL